MNILNIIRNLLGYIIQVTDILTRGCKKKRSKTEQEKINTQTKNWILYQFKRCPFCIKVRRCAHKLNLNINHKYIETDKQAERELINGGGKRKVPCLKIEENGKTTWMYESSHIKDYLTTQFG